MKKLDELIIFFLNLCFSVKNIPFMKSDEKQQNALLKEDIPMIRKGINSYLDSLEKQLEE